MQNTYLVILLFLVCFFGVYRLFCDESSAEYELNKHIRQNSVEDYRFDEYPIETVDKSDSNSDLLDLDILGQVQELQRDIYRDSDTNPNKIDELNFLVFGDFGYVDDANLIPDSEQEKLSELITNRVLDDNANYDFIVSVGDNFYPNGLESEFDEKPEVLLEDTFKMSQLNLDWYSVLGNHDLIGDLDAVLQLNKRYPLWKQTEPYYHKIFNIGNSNKKAGFIFLNSCDLVCRNKRNPECFKHMWSNVKPHEVQNQLRWLEKVLVEMSQEDDIIWKIVVVHNAVFSAGQRHGDNPDLIEMILPLFHKYKVDLILSGHDHSVQYLRMDKNLYNSNGSKKLLADHKTNKNDCPKPPNRKYCSDQEFLYYQLDKCGRINTNPNHQALSSDYQANHGVSDLLDSRYSRESSVDQDEYLHQFVLGNGGTKHEKLCPIKQMESQGNLRYGHSVSGIADIKATEDKLSIDLISVDDDILYSVQIFRND